LNSPDITKDEINPKNSIMVEDLFAPESYKEEVEHIHNLNTHKQFRCNNQGKATDVIKKYIEKHYSTFKKEWFNGVQPVINKIINIFNL
jgi:hypothetical protein